MPVVSSFSKPLATALCCHALGWTASSSSGNSAMCFFLQCICCSSIPLFNQSSIRHCARQQQTSAQHWFSFSLAISREATRIICFAQACSTEHYQYWVLFCTGDRPQHRASGVSVPYCCHHHSGLSAVKLPKAWTCPEATPSDGTTGDFCFLSACGFLQHRVAASCFMCLPQQGSHGCVPCFALTLSWKHTSC